MKKELKGKIVSINKYFDEVNCEWRHQGTIVVDFKEEPEIKIGNCKIIQ